MGYRDNFALIDWSGFKPAPAPRRFVGQRGDVAAPMLIRDGMDPIRNHADGGIYDSKSAYYKAVRAAGCEVVGNDSSLAKAKPKEYVPEGVGHDIKRAIDELKAAGKGKRGKRRAKS
jgi:hypothetical protein